MRLFTACAASDFEKIAAIDFTQNVDSLIDRVFNSNLNAFELNLEGLLWFRSQQGNSQAIANGQAVAYLGVLAASKTGDSCSAAEFINTYTRYYQSGNPYEVREALRNYIQVLNGNIENIVGLLTNAKYESGERDSCPNQGRTYQFDAAWKIILKGANDLINEQYSAAKRLYSASSIISNNVGATFTALSLPLFTKIFVQTSGPMADLLTSFASRSNIVQAANAAKQALLAAANEVEL